MRPKNPVTVRVLGIQSVFNRLFTQIAQIAQSSRYSHEFAVPNSISVNVQFRAEIVQEVPSKQIFAELSGLWKKSTVFCGRTAKDPQMAPTLRP